MLAEISFEILFISSEEIKDLGVIGEFLVRQFEVAEFNLCCIMFLFSQEDKLTSKFRFLELQNEDHTKKV